MQPEELKSTDSGPYLISGRTSIKPTLEPDPQPEPKPYAILSLRSGAQFWQFATVADVVAERCRLETDAHPHIAFTWIPPGERDTQGEWAPVGDMETLTHEPRP